MSDSTDEPVSTDTTSDIPVKRPKSLRSQLIRLVIFVTLVVAVRGFLIATLLKGNYRLPSFLFDAGWALVLFAGLQGFDALVTRTLKKLLGTETSRSRIVTGCIRFAIVIGFSAPFLLATVQLHPPKIGCGQTPADHGLAFTEHRIVTEDGIALSVWKLPAQSRDRPVIVMSHGLGANKQNFLPASMILRSIGYNVITFDFRGHGDSEGHTCSLGVMEAQDVKAAYEFAVREYPGQPVYAWATSLGGAATVRATAEYKIFDKIVIDATFTSIGSVALQTKLSYAGPLARPAWQLCRLWYWVWVGEDIQKHGPLFDIPNITHCPVFLIHGTADPMIPSTESERLHEAGPTTRLWLVKDAGHSQSMMHKDYSKRLREFYESQK